MRASRKKMGERRPAVKKIGRTKGRTRASRKKMEGRCRNKRAPPRTTTYNAFGCPDGGCLNCMAAGGKTFAFQKKLFRGFWIGILNSTDFFTLNIGKYNAYYRTLSGTAICFLIHCGDKVLAHLSWEFSYFPMVKLDKTWKQMSDPWKPLQQPHVP